MGEVLNAAKRRGRVVVEKDVDVYPFPFRWRFTISIVRVWYSDEGTVFPRKMGERSQQVKRGAVPMVEIIKLITITDPTVRSVKDPRFNMAHQQLIVAFNFLSKLMGEAQDLPTKYREQIDALGAASSPSLVKKIRQMYRPNDNEKKHPTEDGTVQPVETKRDPTASSEETIPNG